jgi:hypothetical protein
MLEAKAKYADKLSELKIKELDAQADIVESQSIYSHDSNLDSGKFVNALRGSVRPIITYAFFILFATVKGVTLYTMVSQEGVDLAAGLVAVWDSETQAIFSAIIAFWFGNRAMSKARARVGK